MPWNHHDAAIVRQMIAHEGELINHRLSWLMTLQGLLFTAMAFAWKDAPQLVYYLAILGGSSSLSTLVVLASAQRAIRDLKSGWDANKPEGYDGPGVIGHMPRHNLDLATPWLFLPVLFTVSWVGFACIAPG